MTNTPKKNPLKVICVCSIWPSKDNKNSATQLVQQIAVRSRYASIFVIAPHAMFRSEKIWLSEYSPRPIGFTSPAMPGLSAKKSKFSLLKHICNELSAAFFLTPVVWKRLIVDKAHLIHLHGERGYLFLSHIAKFLFGIPVVLTSHGVSTDGHALGNSKIFKILHKVGYSSIEKLCIVGAPLENYFLNLGVSQKKIQVVPNGHDASTHDPRLVDKIRSQNPERFLIVSVARMSKLKGIDDTLVALSLLKKNWKNRSWLYFHVGDGLQRTELESLATEIGIRENVVFLGHLSYVEAMSYIQAADLFVLPSWGDAFGIVYLEAMSRGVPAIGCVDSGAAETVIDGKTGYLVKKNDCVAISERIAELMSDDDQRQIMAQNARTRAADFTWERNAESYLLRYNQVSQDRSLVV